MSRNAHKHIKKAVYKAAVKEKNIIKKNVHVGKNRYISGGKLTHKKGTLRKSLKVKHGKGMVTIYFDENIANYAYFELGREGTKGGSPHNALLQFNEERLQNRTMDEATKLIIQDFEAG